MTKALYYLNEAGEDWRKKIDSVTASSLSEAVGRALKGNLTFAVEGGEISSIASYDSLGKLFN